MRRLAILAFLAFGATLLPIGSAGAAWLLPPTDLSPVGTNASVPEVATGADGTTAAVWRQFDGSGYRIQVATRAPGASRFSAPVYVSPAEVADNPDVAVGPDGTVTVVWEGIASSDRHIRVSTRAAGTGTFSSPANLTSASSDSPNSPSVAVASTGRTTVIWNVATSSFSYVQTRTRPAGSSTFGTTTNLTSTSEVSFGTEVEAGGDGRTTALLLLPDSADEFEVWTRTMEPGSTTFGAAVPVFEISWPAGIFPDLAVGKTGLTTVAWEINYFGTPLIEVATRAPGETDFEPDGNLTGVSGGVEQPTVSITPNGRTTVAWRQLDGGDWTIQARTRESRSGSFLQAEEVSAPGQDASGPRSASSDDGVTTVTWDRSNGTNPIVQAATMEAGRNAFSRPVNLSASGQNAGSAQIAGGPCDSATTVVWARSNGANQIVQQATRQCSGRVASIRVKGPGQASAGRKTPYRIIIRNAGPGTARGLVVRASGRGINGTSRAGNLGAAKSKTVRLPTVFRKKGRVKVTFTVSAKNAAKKSVRKTVRVR